MAPKGLKYIKVYHDGTWAQWLTFYARQQTGSPLKLSELAKNLQLIICLENEPCADNQIQKSSKILCLEICDENMIVKHRKYINVGPVSASSILITNDWWQVCLHLIGENGIKTNKMYRFDTHIYISAYLITCFYITLYIIIWFAVSHAKAMPVYCRFSFVADELKSQTAATQGCALGTVVNHAG